MLHKKPVRVRSQRPSPEYFPSPSWAAVVLMSLGICLILFGVYWNRAVPSTMFWSEEQHARRSEAATIYHRLAYEKPNSAEAAAAKERYEHHQRDLRHARSFRNTVRSATQWAGVALLALGGIVQFHHTRRG